MQEILSEISEMLQKGKAAKVEELVKEALSRSTPPNEILELALIAGMGIIGEKFRSGEIFVPEVLVSARAMNKGVEVLKPALVEQGVQPKGVAVLGTVKGDMHDIGKNLVKLMMEGKGIKVIDLGVDVPPERFLEAAVEHNARIIGCSALLTTTMAGMKNVVELVKNADAADRIKVMIGGAPVTQKYCEQIGADCYTPDAAAAAEAALAFCETA